MLDEDERRELERLRHEVAALRAAPAPPAPPPPARGWRRGHRIRWASLAAAVLIVLGCVGVPVSVLAIWTHNQVANTDRFIATASPVIENPAVQSGLSNRISAEVLAYIDVQRLANDTVDALAAQGLRPELVDRLHDLTGPLASSVASLVRSKVGELVASPQFTAAWNRALQVTHQQVDAALSGDSSTISIKGDHVVLDLGPFIDAAKQHLVASGFTAAGKIPQVNPTVNLFAASTLVRAQTAYQTLDAVATWLPWITVLLLAAGIYLARHRRRAVLGIGLGVVAGMLVLAAALIIGRTVLVGAVPQQGVATAAATYDILVRFLRTALRTLAVLGLVVAAGAFLVGPSPTAVQVRTTLNRGIGVCSEAGWPTRCAPARSVPGCTPTSASCGSLPPDSPCSSSSSAIDPTGLDVLLITLGLIVVLAIIEFLDQAPELPTTAVTTT